MYLKRAPASSGRATLRYGMSWGPSATGGCNSSFSSSSFHWEIVTAKLEIVFKATYRWNRGESEKQKSFLLHFSFIIIFQKIFLNIWKGILDPFYNPKWLPFSWFFGFLTQKSIFINFGKTNMKTTFGESCSP